MDDGDGDKKPGQVGEGQNIYEVIELIGKGGMAEVWRGRHTRHGRDVAIKFIAAKHRGRDDIAKRFRHEINILLRLNHPHIVTVYDHGKSDDGRLYLVMELLHGPTLEELLRKSTCGQFIDWHTQISIAQQVCNALDATHAQGLVHRDIKPSNISCLPMANQSVHVKLLDFGIAKVREDLKQDRQDESEELTAIGAFIGTHHYAAPEMIRPHEFGVPDGRADLFSLGVVLYRCATGMRPFQGDPNNVVLWKTCTERPPSPRERAPDRQIPASLDALIMRALAIRPDDRFDSASALSAALREVADSLDKPAGPQPRPTHQPTGEAIPAGSQAQQISSSAARPTLPPPDKTVGPEPPTEATVAARQARQDPSSAVSPTLSPPGRTDPPATPISATGNPPANPFPGQGQGQGQGRGRGQGKKQKPASELQSDITTAVHSANTGNHSTADVAPPSSKNSKHPKIAINPKNSNEVGETHEPGNRSTDAQDPEASDKRSLWVAAGLVGIIGISLYLAPPEGDRRSPPIVITDNTDDSESSRATDRGSDSTDSDSTDSDSDSTDSNSTNTNSTNTNSTDTNSTATNTVDPAPADNLEDRKKYKAAVVKLLKSRRKRVRECQAKFGLLSSLKDTVKITVQASGKGRRLGIRVLSKGVSQDVKDCIDKRLRGLITPAQGRGAHLIKYTYNV